VFVNRQSIRNRIEELKLSLTGYERQLARLDLTPERKERLELETRLLGDEIATLEKIAQLGRVEPQQERVEAEVRERLEAVRARLASDPALLDLTPKERDAASGEIKALLWVLGEDLLSQQMQFLLEGRSQGDSGATDRAVVQILIHGLENGPNPDARASAAYDLGKLHVVEGIPALARTIDDSDAYVAAMALESLASFSETELLQAGVSEDVARRVSAARTNPTAN